MRQIFVDSRDRVSGTSTDFAIQLPETLTLEPGHRARVDQLRIPLVVPTIDATNNTIQVLLGATTYTITIPPSNYDGPTLAAVIQGLLSATAPGAWSVVYYPNSIAMSISCSNDFTITGGTYAADLKAHPYTSTANSYSFTYVNMLGIDVMYLSSSQFSTLDTVGPNGAHDTLMMAVVTSSYGSILVVDMPYSSWFEVPAMTTQHLDFQLRDRYYDVLRIVPNISFVLSID